MPSASVVIITLRRNGDLGLRSREWQAIVNERRRRQSAEKCQHRRIHSFRHSDFTISRQSQRKIFHVDASMFPLSRRRRLLSVHSPHCCRSSPRRGRCTLRRSHSCLIVPNRARQSDAFSCALQLANRRKEAHEWAT